ncbi:hypothetical protein J6590_025042 [Homalodisca vitripennis]|nr:hypothetical protein J6590_025042 [Homalodisca vitripennis]
MAMHPKKGCDRPPSCCGQREKTTCFTEATVGEWTKSTKDLRGVSVVLNGTFPNGRWGGGAMTYSRKSTFTHGEGPSLRSAVDGDHLTTRDKSLSTGHICQRHDDRPRRAKVAAESQNVAPARGSAVPTR